MNKSQKSKVKSEKPVLTTDEADSTDRPETIDIPEEFFTEESFELPDITEEIPDLSDISHLIDTGDIPKRRRILPPFSDTRKEGK